MTNNRNIKRERVENCLGALLVFVFLTTIIVAQRSVGWLQLALMLGALLGLLAVLAAYNRRYR